MRRLLTTPWVRWLDVIPATWLALVLGAGALLAASASDPLRRETPGLAALERAALPLLWLLGAAAIIKHLSVRNARPAPETPAPDDAGAVQGQHTP